MAHPNEAMSAAVKQELEELERAREDFNAERAAFQREVKRFEEERYV